ncbi:zf-TFIIB domain-containing protein [Paraburkholderia sp. J41]|uniref:TFIIB-type zinc ribbon-containing protein n=1 Tax=Paraburkholderia sp. J41 TaxID=2805433 RepID=UPI002AC31862|nr:zf-TFIIB domain-containing protein [Paraburkholderia sp. J41]
MKCPNCPDVTLSLTERQGVELDYCPQCRGIWLDRGELDRLIERGNGGGASHGGHGSHDDRGNHGSRDDHAPRRAYDRRDGHERRRKSWLGDLFD